MCERVQMSTRAFKAQPCSRTKHKRKDKLSDRIERGCLLSHAHHEHQNLLRLRLAENINKNARKNVARTYKIHRSNALCCKQQNPTVSRVKIRTQVEQPPVLEAGSRSSAPSIKRYNAPFAEPVRLSRTSIADGMREQHHRGRAKRLDKRRQPLILPPPRARLSHLDSSRR
jgi:hypothetical protein